jgi:transposase InsO family protein
MDWHTRKVLSWRISKTLEADFCVEALNEAIHKFGPPDIMNTDQGSQFTSFAGTDRLRRTGVRISMDGKGRLVDNIFIERLWRTLKYECVYLTFADRSLATGPHHSKYASLSRARAAFHAIRPSQDCPIVRNVVKCPLSTISQYTCKIRGQPQLSC